MRFPRLILLLLCAALYFVSCSENDEDATENLAPDVGVISQVQTASFAMDACARGTELFVAENSDWVNVYDISDPSNPSLSKALLQSHSYLNMAKKVRPISDDYVVIGTNDFLCAQHEDSAYGCYGQSFKMGQDILTSRRLDMIRSDYDNLLHEREVDAVITTDLNEGMQILYAYMDSINAGNVTYYYYQFRSYYRVSHVLNSIPIGLAEFHDPDTLLVTLGDRGIALGVLTRLLPYEDYEITVDWISAMDTPGYAQGLAVDDNIIYIADGFAGLQMVDAYDPIDPAIIFTWCEPEVDNAVDVAVSGNKIALLDDDAGVAILERYAADRITFVSWFNAINPTSVSFTDAGNLVVTSEEKGITILELEF